MPVMRPGQNSTVSPAWSGIQSFFGAGLSRMAEDQRRRSGMPATPAPMGSLPTSARVPSQYPAGVPIISGRPAGVGGGNAGASRASQGPAAAPAPAPRPTGSATSSGGWAPATQGNPRLPAGRNVAIVTPRHQAQNRALDQAAQNAGLPAWNWKAEENKAVFDAVEARGRVATAARQEQGGRGYITGENLPGALDQSKAEYWQSADMQAWAAANPELAKRAMARAGYNPQQGTLPALAAAAAQAPASGPGAMNGPEWSFAKPAGELTGQLARGAAAVPGYDAGAMSGPDFQAPAPAATSWRVQEMAMPASGPGASVGTDWSFTKPSGPVTQPLAAAAAALPGYDINAMSKPDFTPVPAAAPAQTMALAQDQQFPLTPGSVLPGGGPAIDDQAQARLQDYLQRIKNLNPTEWNFSRRAS